MVDGTPLEEALKASPFLSRDEELEQLLSSSAEITPERRYSWLAESGNFVSRPRGILDERAWAFQETLLSSPIISITKDGLFWDCLHHSASDRRPVGILGDFSLKFRSSDERTFKHSLLKSNLSRPHEHSYALWRRVVQGYTKREITKKDDRLVALEGVTRQMASMLDDECVLGIWRKNALRSLIWFREHQSDHTSDRSTTRDFGFPSWSWFSLGRSIDYRLWHPYARSIDRIYESNESTLPIATVRHLPAAHCPYSSYLSLKGPVARGFLLGSDIFISRRVSDDPSTPTQSELIAQRQSSNKSPSTWAHVTNALLDHEPKNSTVETVNCILLLEGGYSDSLNAQYCLILRRLPREGRPGLGYYERIGLCALNTLQICVSAKSLCTRDHADYSDCMGVLEYAELL